MSKKERLCVNCRFMYASMSREPCKTCLPSKENRPSWKPLQLIDTIPCPMRYGTGRVEKKEKP